MTVEWIRWLRMLMLFGPAVGLAALGLIIVFRSGVVGPDGAVGVRSITGSISQVIARLAWWVVGFAIVGEIVGLRTFLQAP